MERLEKIEFIICRKMDLMYKLHGNANRATSIWKHNIYRTLANKIPSEIKEMDNWSDKRVDQEYQAYDH